MQVRILRGQLGPQFRGPPPAVEVIGTRPGSMLGRITGSTLDFGSSRCWFESSPSSHCSLAQLAVASASGAEGSKFESWVSSGRGAACKPSWLQVLPGRVGTSAKRGLPPALTLRLGPLSELVELPDFQSGNLRVQVPHGLQGDTGLMSLTPDVGEGA